MATTRPRIPIDHERIAAFCRQWQITELALFGSVLRDDFTPDSDVDVLVEFEPEHVPGLAFFAMQDELSSLLGRNVDLNTAGFLSPYFRDRVQRDAEVLYVDPR
jgi:predicted nucleotidyltransferase